MTEIAAMCVIATITPSAAQQMSILPVNRNESAWFGFSSALALPGNSDYDRAQA
jgi:hypothetical protein